MLQLTDAGYNYSQCAEYDGVLCIRREDREMRGNFVHCHCSLWPGLLGLATENKTKKLQKLLSVCLGAAAPPLTTFTSTPTLRRQCLVNQCRMSHTVSTLPPPPRNNNNNSNDSPSDPLLATHATKTFIGERKDSTAPFAFLNGGKII